MSNDKLPIKERYFEGDDSFTKDYVKSIRFRQKGKVAPFIR